MDTTPHFEPVNEFHEVTETDFAAPTNNTESVSIDSSFDCKSLGLPSKFGKYINNNFNISQIKAIQRAAQDEGFTLVQGPPGTGKTSTLLGMLNAIHLREYNKYYAFAIATVIGPEGWKCRQSANNKLWLNLVSSLSKLKPHILVTAPSNIAVDNIIQRIIAKGFVDGNGGRYNPNILRFGAGKSSSVKVVSL